MSVLVEDFLKMVYHVKNARKATLHLKMVQYRAQDVRKDNIPMRKVVHFAYSVQRAER
jgi:hypothetical protein